MLRFKVAVVSANNLLPLDDKESVFVKWKVPKPKVSGQTDAVAVKRNCAEFHAPNSFEVLVSSAFTKKGPPRVPFKLALHVVNGKKSKEVAFFAFDDLMALKQRPDPFTIKAKVEWVKAPKQLEAALAKTPADLQLRVEVSEVSKAEAAAAAPAPVVAPAPAPAPTHAPTPTMAKKDPVKESEGEDEVHQSSEKTNDFEPESNTNSVPVAVVAKKEPKEKEHKEKKEESQSYNPFAILSRKVGSESTSAPSSSPAVDEEGMTKSRTSDSGASSNAAEVKRLAAENKKLREQLDRSEAQKQELSRKLASVQTKTKMLEKSVPKAAMKELRKEGYKSENADGSGRPAGESEAEEAIVSCLRSVLADTDSMNEQSSTYWLSWVTNLHIALCNHNGLKSTVIENGVEIKKSPVNAAEPGTIRHFLISLEFVLEDAYKLTLRMILDELKSLVEKKVRNFWDVEIESSVVGQDVVNIFERWFGFLVNNNVPRSVLNQWFFQSLHFLGCAMFNSFLANPQACEPAVALQLKFYISELENWAADHSTVLYHWRSFKQQIQPVIDLSNLLLIDKASMNCSMLREGAPSLAPIQLKYLLDHDQGKESERVSKTVMKEITDLAGVENVPLQSAMIKENQWFVLADLTK